MAHKVYWLQEPVILCHEMVGDYDVARYQEALAEELARVAESATSRVYSLRDMTDVTKVPTNVGVYKQIIAELRAAGVVFEVLVQPNRLMRYMVEVMRHVAGVSVRVFDDRTEAEMFLRQLAARDDQLSGTGALPDLTNGT